MAQGSAPFDQMGWTSNSPINSSLFDQPSLLDIEPPKDVASKVNSEDDKNKVNSSVLAGFSPVVENKDAERKPQKEDDGTTIRDPHPISSYDDYVFQQCVKTFKRAWNAHSDAFSPDPSASMGINTSANLLDKNEGAREANNGEYKGVSTSSNGNGTGAVLYIKVEEKKVKEIRALKPGFGYKDGDTLIISLPGDDYLNNTTIKLNETMLQQTADGASCGIKTQTNALLSNIEIKGATESLKANEPYVSLPITKGSGTGARMTVVFDENKTISGVTVTRAGYGYKPGDTLSVTVDGKKPTTLTFKLKKSNIILNKDDEIIELYTACIKEAKNTLKKVLRNLEENSNETFTNVLKRMSSETIDPSDVEIEKTGILDLVGLFTLDGPEQLSTFADKISNLIAKAYFQIGTIYERRPNKTINGANAASLVNNYQLAIQARKKYGMLKDGKDDFETLRAQARVGHYLIPHFKTLKETKGIVRDPYKIIVEKYQNSMSKKRVPKKWTVNDAKLLEELVLLREEELERVKHRDQVFKFIANYDEQHDIFTRDFGGLKNKKQIQIFLRDRYQNLDPKQFSNKMSKKTLPEHRMRKIYESRAENKREAPIRQRYCKDWDDIKNKPPKKNRPPRQRRSSRKTKSVEVTTGIPLSPGPSPSGASPLPSQSTGRGNTPSLKSSSPDNETPIGPIGFLGRSNSNEGWMHFN